MYDNLKNVFLLLELKLFAGKQIVLVSVLSMHVYYYKLFY